MYKLMPESVIKCMIPSNKLSRKKMSVNEIVQQILICRNSLSYEDVTIAIEKKKVISEGLLTDESAARLVASELGVSIEPRQPPPKICINQLFPGLNDVTVFGRVLLVDPPRIFQMQDREGQLAQLLIADKTGTIKVLLWHDKTEFIERIQQNQIVKILHAYVRKSRKGTLELHLGRKGGIQILPKEKVDDCFPSINDLLKKVGEINKGHRNVNTKGTILSINPTSTFPRKDGGQGKVRRIMLHDETGVIPVVFWNGKTEVLDKAREGVAVLLINAKVRRSQDNLLELHIGWFTNVKYLSDSEISLHIKDLREGMFIVLVEGEVSSKPIIREIKTRSGEILPLVSFDLEDETGQIKVSTWRQHTVKTRVLRVGTIIQLRNVHVRRGFGDQLEITTRSSSEIRIIDHCKKLNHTR